MSSASYKNTPSTERIFSFQKILRNEEPVNPNLTLLEWMLADENLSLGKQSTFTQSNKKYQEIHFSLSGPSVVHYPLFRSLIASGNSQSGLHTNHSSRNFILTLEAEQETAAKNYLSKILNILKAEIRFKQVLRKVIINQGKFELEEKLLFHELSK